MCKSDAFPIKKTPIDGYALQLAKMMSRWEELMGMMSVPITEMWNGAWCLNN